MTILYACISRGSVVLCSHQNGNWDYVSDAKTLFPQMANSTGQKSYNCDRYLFHTLVENGIIFLCCAGSEFGCDQPYAFLKEIHGRISNSSLVFRLQSASFNGLQRDFQSILASQMERFSKSVSAVGGQNTSLQASTTNRENSQLGRLQNQVDEVRDVMSQNIEKVLQRGERLEDLVDRSEELEASSQQFHSTSRLVARKFWWQNLRMKIILGVTVFVVVFVLIIIILFATKVLPVNSKDAPTTSKP